MKSNEKEGGSMREGTNHEKVKVIIKEGPQFEEKKKEAYRILGKFIRRELAKEQQDKKE
jgi:hypothetical protein